MADIIQFVPEVQYHASKNLAKFVDMCRNQLTIFGADLDWDSDAWDVTREMEKRGYKARIALVWTNHDTSKQSMAPIMSQPFLDFAKAYMRYQHSMKPTKSIGSRLSAIRALERALVEQHNPPKVEKADAAVFNRAAQLVREKFEPSTSHKIGSQLKMLSSFLRENRLTATPFEWRNPIPRQRDSNTARVGKKFDEERADKLPTQDSLEALAKIFHIATEPVDIIVSSIAALLCSAPDRINEVLRLSVDCEVAQRKPDGEEAYGLRWWPAKGAEPMVKWVVATMVDVVKDALIKIREQTEEARRMARWYDNNPGKLYLSEGLEYLRNHEYLTSKELELILGLTGSGSLHSYAKTHNIRSQTNGGKLLYNFKDIEQSIIDMLPRGFPILDAEIRLKYSEALFIVPKNKFHSQRATYNCMFEIITFNNIRDNLGGREKHGVSSMFGRLGFTEPDGSPIKISTHQFRHWLNTLAQKGGLSQLDIAKWSGRKDIRQNEAYDHVTADEFLQKVRDIDDGNMFGPLAEFVSKTPVSREEFLQLKFPTAHTTELGFCIHDWTMLPCDKHRDCINCTEHVCLKGDIKKTERIRQCLIDAEAQLMRAEQALGDSYAGADRWLEHHRLTVERLKNLVMILDDPNVPVGAVIQLSIKGEFSQIGLAIEERRGLGDGDAELLNKVRALKD